MFTLSPVYQASDRHFSVGKFSLPTFFFVFDHTMFSEITPQAGNFISSPQPIQRKLTNYFSSQKIIFSFFVRKTRDAVHFSRAFKQKIKKSTINLHLLHFISICESFQCKPLSQPKTEHGLHTGRRLISCVV